MKNTFTLILSLIGFLVNVNAQTTGDYRSFSSGNWGTNATWEIFNGTTWVASGNDPTSADGVITIRSPHTVIVNAVESGDQVIVESGAVLIITATLTLNNGAGNDIEVNGVLNLQNTLDGTGSVLVSNTGSLLLSTITVKQTSTNVQITNNGTLTWDEGGLNFSGPVINNNVFNITASALWQFSGGLTNNGTINKSAGATNISTPWSNSGNINLTGGSLSSGAAFTNTGNITFSPGFAWNNNSTFNHNTGSVLTGTGSFTNNGTLSLAIPLVFPSTIIFASNGNINGPGALTVNNDFAIRGSVTGGSLTVNGNADWQDGTLGRPITVNAGRVMSMSTAAVKTSEATATITNNGTLAWLEGGLNMSGAVINNNIFNISANALWQFGGGLTNNGTINKTTGASVISTPWTNSGTINMSGGSLTSSQPFTNTGSILFSSGATWNNNSNFNHNTGSVVTGTGNFANAGTLTLNISQVFPATLIFSNTNTINGPGDLTINNDFVIKGSITGGNMTLDGNGDWQDGTLGRSLTMPAGRTLLLSTPGVKTFNSGSTLINNGTLIWQEGGLNIGGVIINNNVFNITATALWQFSGGLTNNGTINKSAGAAIIRTPWSNSGTINVTGGSLNSDGVFTNTGSIIISNGASWINSSGFNHNSGSVITGTGNFSNSGTFSLAIPQVFPSTLIFSNTGNINGPGALTINNDFVIQGSITGGPMTLNGNGDFQAGTFGRTLTIGAGRTFLLSTSNVKTFESPAVLTNDGTMSWLEGILNFAGAVVNNNVFNISSSTLWQFSGGLTNNGTINKSGGASIIRTPWSNSGTINVTGGSLNSDGVFTNTGSIIISNGASWINSSGFNHNSGSIITGTGNFSNSGTFSLAVAQVFPATLIFTNTGFVNGPGALTINHDFIIQGTIVGGPMTLNGNGNFQSGTLGRSLTIDAGRTFLLSTTNVKTFESPAVLTNNGTLTWQDGILNFAGAIINNNVFNIEANNTFWQFSGGLTNNAIVNKTSTGAINFITPVTNAMTGTIKGVGTITFSSTFTNSGILSPGINIGTFTTNGTAPLSANSTLQIELLNGAGVGTGHDQLIRSGNLTLNGTLTVVETGTVPDGIYTIIDLSSGVISGNFTTVNLPPGYTMQVYTDNVRVGKNVPLSLTLVSFTGRKTHDQKVDLEWVSVDEENVSHFEMQRSTDGRNFTQIAKINALNNPKGGTYHFTDESPFSQNNYYRLKIVDLDASAKLSPVVMVKITGSDHVNVYPTITSDRVYIDTDKIVNAKLFSLSRALLKQKQVSGHDFIDLSDLAIGMYVLVLDETGESIKILKQ